MSPGKDLQVWQAAGQSRERVSSPFVLIALAMPGKLEVRSSKAQTCREKVKKLAVTER